MEGNDELFVKKFLSGDENSFRVLVDKYTTSIFNFSARFVGKDSASDITQDVFVKVWKNIRRFDEKKSSFKTWVFTITRNTVIDFLKKKKSTIFSSLDSEGERFEDNIKDEKILPEEALIKLEDEELLNKLVDELPVNFREVLILHYQEDMTFAEIGELLNKPSNTVKSYHYRALLILKEKLAPKL